MNTGLSDGTVSKLKMVFSSYPELNEVILYGSRAKGNYRDGSDIDLTLIGNDLTLSLLYRIADDIDELMLPYKVDLSLFHQIDNENLKDHINRDGISFYRSKKS